MIKWTEKDIENLKLGLELELSHEEIADCLDRSKSSVMHKVQRLGLSKTSIQWNKILSREEVISLIRIYRTSEAMDYTEEVPGHKSCQKILGVSSWNECLELAGLPIYKQARFKSDRKTRFYIVKFEDINGVIFNKFGITQRTVQMRYSKKDIEIVNEVIGTLEYCQDLEYKFSKLVSDLKYLPEDKRFYNDTYGGYSECYISREH